MDFMTGLDSSPKKEEESKLPIPQQAVAALAP